jgi:hypothetical protein
MNFKRWARVGLVPLFVSLLTSCASERPPINRVQADALSKDFFVGKRLHDASDDPEFYWRNYVVDASAGQSLIGIGSWSGVDRIRWEITETMLIARKAYQIAKGADDKGLPEKDPNGAVVAAYKILSHFDIRRVYNQTTGEEMNIIEENSVDRRWFDRAYMRVDWSSNDVQNPMWTEMFMGKVMGDVVVTPRTYHDSDPSSPNAPYFDSKAGYFDVTNHYLIAPAETDSPFSDLTGKVPTCMVVGLFTGSATYDCNAQEAVVRSSYLRIDDEAEDFEPLENTNAPLDVVGNPGGIGDSFEVGVVTPGQQGWDPGYGYVDKLYHRFAHIHNNWKKSHQKGTSCTINDDIDDNGTADECENARTGYEGSNGSQCDEAMAACTIPYRDRDIRTIGYWVNKDIPEDLLDPVDEKGNPTARGAAEDLAYSWNQLMSVAIGYAREVECRRTGDGDRASCHAQFFEDQKVMLSYGAWLVDQPKEKTPALTLCHNPVRSYDLQETCGKKGYQARVGDIRHNFLFYWPYESRAPWGGIANWNADPLTGRILGAAAQIMGRSVTVAAATQRDIVQLSIGDITVEDITNGVPADNYAHYLKNGSIPSGLTQREIDERVKGVDAAHAMQTINPAPLPGASVSQRYRSFVDMQKASAADPTQTSTAQLEFEAIADKLRGSVHEAQLVDSHWMVGALGLDPATPIDDAVLDQASPLRGLDSGRLHAWRDAIQAKLRLHGVCFMDNEAPIAGSIDMQGLGGYFQKKYEKLDKTARGEAIYRELYVEAFKGIAIHEMGHSLGMLHQFASSWDSPNFNPQYWQLRTDEGKATRECAAPRSGDQDSCMGPRYVDPPTGDEQGLAGESRPGIEYFANTSVMEYQVERFGETVGLGTYDLHVMKALYGRVLETMDDETRGGMAPAEQKSFAPRLETQLTEQDRVVRSIPALGGTAAWPTHYTEVARMMKVFDPARDCRDATQEEKARAAWRLVHGKVCSPAPRDHAAWSDFDSDNLPGSSSNAPYWHTRPTAKTAPDHVRWFYRWGTNHNAYFHTNDSDAGADPYEVTVNTARKFDISYPFSYFRRKNREFFYDAIPSATADRYFERMRSFHWLVANSTAFYRSFGADAYEIIANDDNWHRPYLLAGSEMFNLLARAVLMPEPGAYVSHGVQPGQAQPIHDLPSFGGAGTFRIGAVDGRFIGDDFDSTANAGGSWDYLHWMNHAGFSTEKAYAMRALADGRPNLFTISRENFLDGRAVKINFRNDMQAAVDRLIGGVLAEDWDAVAPWVAGQGNLTSAVPVLLDLTVAKPERPAGSRNVFPNIGYKQQLATLVFVATFSRLNTDMNLVDKMRLWIDGQVGSVNVPDDQQLRFYDPATGYTYIARRYGRELVGGKLVDKGIASRMLEHANALVVASYEVDTDEDGQAILDAYGAPHLRLDGDGQPIPKDPDTSKLGDLTRYVGLLDATRQIGQELGYGPIDGASMD